jgi:3-phenylpropionate/cinnamic acid dioxygenase small subunit
MTILQTQPDSRMSLEQLLLAREIEEFLYREAATIDARRFEEWLAFFADDLRYWVPIRKNLPFNRRFEDMTGDHESAWIDDSRGTLEARVYQVMTKIHWAEEPLSRVSHLVTNILIDAVEEDDGDQVITVNSKLLVHRSRLEEAGEMLIAKREDKIRRGADGLKIFWRRILIDQATLHLKNLSFFI